MAKKSVECCVTWDQVWTGIYRTMFTILIAIVVFCIFSLGRSYEYGQGAQDRYNTKTYVSYLERRISVLEQEVRGCQAGIVGDDALSCSGDFYISDSPVGVK